MGKNFVVETTLFDKIDYAINRNAFATFYLAAQIICPIRIISLASFDSAGVTSSIMFYDSISPAQLAEKLKNGAKINLIDVREAVEYEIARIEAATLLPLSRFREWIDDLIAGLDHENETIVMCHHGVRSAHLCGFLAQNGVEKVFNLEGGIDAWSAEIDANVPRY